MAITAVLGIGACVFAVSTEHTRDASAADVVQSRQRLVFVSYLDSAADERGQRNFETLRAAMLRLDPALGSEVDMELAQFVVAEGESIDDGMKRIVASRPAVIVATSDDVLDAARRNGATMPVLFASHVDPVAAGYVHAIAAPGVARTGITYHVPLTAKMVEVLQGAFRSVRRIGVIADRLRAGSPDFGADLHAAAQALGVQVTTFVATNADEVAALLGRPESERIDAWYVPVGEALWNDEDRVLELMERVARPVLYERVRLARRPGSLAYEPRFTEPFLILAGQAVLVLRGADVAAIPVERPSEFELAINLTPPAGSWLPSPTKSAVMRANTLILTDATPAQQVASAP